MKNCPLSRTISFTFSFICFYVTISEIKTRFVLILLSIKDLHVSLMDFYFFFVLLSIFDNGTKPLRRFITFVLYFRTSTLFCVIVMKGGGGVRIVHKLSKSNFSLTFMISVAEYQNKGILATGWLKIKAAAVEFYLHLTAINHFFCG